MRSEDELSFFAPLDDQRFAAVSTRCGLLATEQALGRHSGGGELFAVGTGDIPPHAGANAQRLVGL